jgi:arylformamidase
VAIFLDYDQAQLDACYDQAVWAPNAAVIHRRQASLSDVARAHMAPALRRAYGSGPMEHLDIFRSARDNAPVFVFVHGGAWKASTSERHAYIAEAYVAAGAHAVLLDFNGVDELNGDLRAMVDQVRQAVLWVHRNAAEFGGDPNRIHLCGHSSGAHLGGCVLATDWSEYGAPGGIIAGGLVCSGMYDLAPVALSARRHYVNFDPETIERLSSQRSLERITMPVIVAYGTAESPEFQRQNREFASALQAAGKAVQLIVAEGYNHFEIPETLANPYGLLGRAMFAQMGIAAVT